MGWFSLFLLFEATVVTWVYRDVNGKTAMLGALQKTRHVAVPFFWETAKWWFSFWISSTTNGGVHFWCPFVVDFLCVLLFCPFKLQKRTCTTRRVPTPKKTPLARYTQLNTIGRGGSSKAETERFFWGCWRWMPLPYVVFCFCFLMFFFLLAFFPSFFVFFGGPFFFVLFLLSGGGVSFFGGEEVPCFFFGGGTFGLKGNQEENHPFLGFPKKRHIVREPTISTTMPLCIAEN